VAGSAKVTTVLDSEGVTGASAGGSETGAATTTGASAGGSETGAATTTGASAGGSETGAATSTGVSNTRAFGSRGVVTLSINEEEEVDCKGDGASAGGLR
jgi:hypothetical protein